MADEIDTMFEDAVNALRQGDQAHAKEILTRLLKADQTNATYWVWMSGAVETPKERIYCLETALKLDPENATAKRGLILHGALPPDENIQPFPLNRPRAWEEKLLLAHEMPKESGFRARHVQPGIRLAGVILIGVLVCRVGRLRFLRHAQPPSSARAAIHTAGPTPTFTLTPTFVNATRQPAATQARTHPAGGVVRRLLHGHAVVRQYAALAGLTGYLPRGPVGFSKGRLGSIHQQHEPGCHHWNPMRPTSFIISARPIALKATAARR